jgi:hypothetical protein
MKIFKFRDKKIKTLIVNIPCGTLAEAIEELERIGFKKEEFTITKKRRMKMLSNLFANFERGLGVFQIVENRLVWKRPTGRIEENLTKEGALHLCGFLPRPAEARAFIEEAFDENLMLKNITSK